MRSVCEGVSDPDCVTRFWAQVQITEGCWLWAGGLQTDRWGIQYGLFRGGAITSNDADGRPRRRKIKPHRFMWELWHGPLGDLDIRHDCDTTLCVRPSHLRPGTPAENSRDCLERGRRALKLSNREVLEVYSLAWNSPYTEIEIAAAYGVSSALVSCIKLRKRRSWALALGL